METFALKEMAILGCGYNGFSQLSPNSAKFSEWKVKEFKSIQLDLKPQEKILQCALSWSQIAFSTGNQKISVYWMKCSVQCLLKNLLIKIFLISPKMFEKLTLPVKHLQV